MSLMNVFLNLWKKQIYFNNKNSKQHDAIQLWNSCKNSDGNVRLKNFEDALLEAGMDGDEAKRLIDRWEKNNVVKLMKDGSYKRI